MQLSKPNAVPKPKNGPSRASVAEAKGRKFREAVWKRDGFKNGLGTYSGYCVRCTRLVCQSDNGEIDHRKPKSTHPELKYEPSNGRITCHDCNQWFKNHPLERDL
jgi:5-methylcytosine-specific restriction endonuclease McrA